MVNNIPFNKKLLLPMLLSVATASTIIGGSSLNSALAGEVQTVRIQNITEQLAPSKLLGGDREFDGHGPAVKSNVRLRIGDSGRSLYADIYIHAKETQSDWSETEGKWTRKVWEAPRGKRISRIVSDQFSETKFISKAAGFEILGPGADFKKFAGDILKALTVITGNSAEQILGLARRGLAAIPDGADHIHIVTPSGDDRTELVKLFGIVGDTGGDDISDDNNPKNDTRIVGIQFNPVRVEFAGSVSPTPPSSKNLKGWVWFNGSSAPNSYQYNSKGGTNTVSRLGVGRYRVNLPKLGIASGTVHVTAYNSDRHCKVVNWSPSGTTQRVNVNCFQANGTRADSKFSMLFYKRSGKTRGTDAYLWYNGSTASSTYAWNSQGLNNSVSKLSTGRYQAKLPGMNKLGGTVLVTAYGSDAAKCKVVNWGRGASNTTVNVSCFQGNKPVNSKFTLSYINGTNGVGNGFTHKGGYVWGNSPNATGTYTPSNTYQWNSATSSNNSNKITKLSTGSYRVNLPQLIPANKTNTQVTAYGNNSDYCNISSWISDGSGGTNANVKCFNSAGKAVDTRFTLTYLTNK